MDEAWLSTVRLARDIGDISSLFPPGVTRLTDVPFTLHSAILGALGFLSFDELPEEEQPPKVIWLDEDKMKAHWGRVKAAREARMGGEPPMESTGHMDKLKIVGPDG